MATSGIGSRRVCRRQGTGSDQVSHKVNHSGPCTMEIVTLVVGWSGGLNACLTILGGKIQQRTGPNTSSNAIGSSHKNPRSHAACVACLEGTLSQCCLSIKANATIKVIFIVIDIAATSISTCKGNIDLDKRIQNGSLPMCSNGQEPFQNWANDCADCDLDNGTSTPLVDHLHRWHDAQLC